MAGVEQEGEVIGFEEGISWLPSHVIDEAIWDTKKEYVKKQQHQHQCHHHHHHHHHHQSRMPLDTLQNLRSKSSPRPPYSRKRNPTNWATGGPGMQAIFLDSGKKSCGTGVFLPTRGGTNSPVSKKPACSPVLLPARVVQALNINVHEIGLQISRRQDAKKNSSKDGEFKSVKNKTRKDASGWNENASPDIFLPKEWTY